MTDVTKMTDDQILEFVRENVTEADISYRGGNLRVDVSELFPAVAEPVMGAYQNYLGGGIAGRIVGAAMFGPDELPENQREHYHRVSSAIVAHFHEINGGGGDEHMAENYGSLEFNQSLPISAY